MINRNNIYFFFILYISLLLGFYFDENLNIGAKPDWYFTNFPVIKDFSENFSNTFLNYDLYGHRHSPVYLFFKCLIIKFKNIDINILFLLSISIF